MEDTLKQVIADIMKIDKSIINDDTDFKNDLKCDSIELFSIIMAMEEKYGKEIPNDKLMNIKTVGDAIKAIKEIM
ncbi:MAG: acyl carrier protein [Lachnospiraceae bacterium]|nr:acyl carrier protein [Lachnospiraceae bacterium]